MSGWICSLQSVHSIGATSGSAGVELAGADDSSAAVSEKEVHPASPGDERQEEQAEARPAGRGADA